MSNLNDNIKLMQTAFDKLKKQAHSSISINYDKSLIIAYCHSKDNAMMMVIEAFDYSDNIHITKERIIARDEYKIEIKF